MVLFSALAFVLLLAVAYPIARPFLVSERADDGTTELRDQRDRLAGSLVDLDMEFSTGKLAEEDYEVRRARRLAELDEAERDLAGRDLAGRDLAAFESPAAAAPAGPGDDEELERLIAERRLALSVPVCRTCGAGHDPDDRFCRACGTDLSEVTSS